MSVKLKNGGLQGGVPDGKGPDRWYVTDGLNAVGPVQLTLLVRGVEAGRVPLESFVRHEAWKVWRPLADFAETDGIPDGVPTAPHPLSSLLEHERALADGSSLFGETGEYPDRVTIEVSSEAAPSTDHTPSMVDEPSIETPTQLSRDLLGSDRQTLASLLDDEETKIPDKKPSLRPSAAPAPTSTGPRLLGVSPQTSSARAATSALLDEDDDEDEGKTSPSVKPPRLAPPPPALPSIRIDDLETATDLSGALHLLMNAIVRQAHAEAALVHRMADDGATVICAHGPNMVALLGGRTRLLDPAVVAAAGGSVIVAEPAPGPAGDAVITRLRKLGLDADGGAMLPIRPRGRLLGIVEIGKAQRFAFRELAIAEELVAAFVARAEAVGWTS